MFSTEARAHYESRGTQDGCPSCEQTQRKAVQKGPREQILVKKKKKKYFYVHFHWCFRLVSPFTLQLLSES